MFLHHFTNQPSSSLPSFQVHLRIYLQEAFGREAGPASAMQGCLFDFLQCHRFSISACDGQTPSPSPHPLGLSLSKSPLSLPSSLLSILLSRATKLQTANLKGSKGFLKLLPNALMWCSVTQPRPTSCDPVDCSTPGFPVLHRLPELAQIHIHRVTDALQPSPPLSPLLLLPPILPSTLQVGNQSLGS